MLEAPLPPMTALRPTRVQTFAHVLVCIPDKEDRSPPVRRGADLIDFNVVGEEPRWRWNNLVDDVSDDEECDDSNCPRCPINNCSCYLSD